MADKITPTDTLASLDADAKPEPYILGVGNQLIKFPDPLELDFEESDEFLASMRTATDSSAFLRRWLSDEDYQALADAKPTGRQIQALVRRVLAHYELVMGEPGEERTSGIA